MKRTTAAVLLACAPWAACAATPIYRCGPDGRIYSQTPCPEGKVVEGTDGRTAAQRAAAARMVAQERHKAAQLERERRAQEAKDKPALATGINGRPSPPDAAASPAGKGKSKKAKKAAESNDFVAVEPAPKKTTGTK